ncbi:MAG: SGNH/GDSL hydrolase family protein [Verrucomicrobiota bacterium JB023]|nr:SGNH/GDSL hydrolase family protein [Verrucomicrobiota bacterium JB023]
MKRLILLLIAVSCLPTPAVLNAVYVFGDSLSDSGNEGRWTNGLLWHEQIGIATSPSDTGGTIYARGGAQTADVLTQVDDYLLASGGVADPLATYVIFVGGNDLGAIAASSRNIFQVFNRVNNRVTQLLNQAVELTDLGATQVLIANAPDVSLTPLATDLAAGDQAALAALANLAATWNLRLSLALASLGDPRVSLFNIAAPFSDMNANPSSYGLTNVTGTIINDSPAYPSEYLYYDSFHPGDTAHAELASLFLATVPEPATGWLGLLGCALLAGRRQRKA